MSSPFLGEIRMFGGNFAPYGWAYCDGALIAIAQNEALYTLLGTTYGGDGVNTFALPDLRGRTPVHQGTGQGLSTCVLGQRAGSESVTLSVNQYPAHTHPFSASTDAGSVPGPGGDVLAGSLTIKAYTDGVANVSLNPAALAPSGGGAQAHDNMQPFLCISFIIALNGIFPTQN
jgi:microcystin-dependent protein